MIPLWRRNKLLVWVISYFNDSCCLPSFTFDVPSLKKFFTLYKHFRCMYFHWSDFVACVMFNPTCHSWGLLCLDWWCFCLTSVCFLEKKILVCFSFNHYKMITTISLFTICHQGNVTFLYQINIGPFLM